MVNGSECHGQQRQGGKLDFNELCVSITAVVTSIQAIIRGMHVNIPYGHAPLPDSDDLLYSNNFSISYAHL